MSILEKLLPYLVAEPTSVSRGEKFRAAFAAFVAVLIVALVSSQTLSGAGLPIMLASVGASAVLLFAIPHSPLTQPWPLVGGHFISVFIGIACAKLIPFVWLAAALAVSLSLLAMHLTHSLHPPGGAATLLPILGGSQVHAEGYHFLLVPVGLNVLVLLLMALVINNLRPGHRYPARAFPGRDKAHRHDDPAPLDRLGFSKTDLKKALQNLDIVLDISEADLNRVYGGIGAQAYRRKMGEITCGDIMSRDLISVGPETELEEVWALLRYHKVATVPVVDPDRKLVGIITLVDFLKRADLKKYEDFEEKLVKVIRGTPGAAAEKASKAKEIMVTSLVTVPETMHIVDLVPLLSNRGLHHIPIVDAEQRLAGMVTQSDLIAALYTGGTHA
ncbi:MAG: HPP family protein [Sulfuricella sp.]|jgi:CBS domain-containing membrane protein|nr:HPP family protein [Sulfuricella sp.]